MPQTPVYADLPTQSVDVSVTSAAGSAGQAVPITTPTVTVNLDNRSAGPVEFQIGAGAWQPLARGAGIPLALNLANTTLKLRKGASTLPMAFLVNVEAVSGTQLVTREGGLLLGLVVSSAAPVNADGRPDGTIYIQTA